MMLPDHVTGDEQNDENATPRAAPDGAAGEQKRLALVHQIREQQ